MERQKFSEQKKINRFKNKYAIKRILNNINIFSNRFIEVIHKVDSNTGQIVTIQTVDASNQKLNKQISSQQNLTLSRFQSLLLIKLDLDNNQLFRDSDWVVNLQNIQNIKQIKRDDGYQRRFIFMLQRTMQLFIQKSQNINPFFRQIKDDVRLIIHKNMILIIMSNQVVSTFIKSQSFLTLIFVHFKLFLTQIAISEVLFGLSSQNFPLKAYYFLQVQIYLQFFIIDYFRNFYLLPIQMKTFIIVFLINFLWNRQMQRGIKSV
ncbi:hypothetical protein pb186bvf_008283 [Paramecium bursaria]